MRRTLLLNNTYEPLAVVSLTRAVSLVVAGKADVLAAGEGEFRSEHTSVPVPEVIRLRYYVKVPYRTKLRLTRHALMARDDHKCGYCGHKATTIDHIRPRSKGGKHVWENVVACCRPCNQKKGNKQLSELSGWKLRSKPYAPKGIRWVIIGIGTLEPAWEEWLRDVPIESVPEPALALV
jgi:5-methylcytosine-specific restriction endonuclease McrA